MKIIGGEFQIESEALNNRICNFNKPIFSLGRTCLYSIFSTIKREIGGVLLPDYICSSVVEVPIRLDIPIKHYHVTTSFNPDLDNIRSVVGTCNERYAILLVSYFGMIDLDDIIQNIRDDYPDMFIIVDDVQNFYGFGNHRDYDFCFTSYRKWFAIPDGADVIEKEDMPEIERYGQSGAYVSYKAAGNLLKNHRDMLDDSIPLELIDKGENMMDEEYLFCSSELSQDLFKRIDTKSIAEKRKRNAEYLHKGLERLNIPHLYDPEKVPLFIPIVIKERDSVRKKLFAEKIFTPIHWPLLDAPRQGLNTLYETELSLICDQRYDENDMERILRGIENTM